MVVTKANQPTNQPPPEQNNNKQCQTEIGLHSQKKKPKTDIRKNDSTFLLGTKFCLEIIFSTAFRCLTFLAIFQSTNQSQRIQFNSIAIDKYAHIKHTAAIANMNLINI